MLRLAVAILLLGTGLAARVGALAAGHLQQQPDSSLPCETARFEPRRALRQMLVPESTSNTTVMQNITAPLPAGSNTSLGSSSANVSSPAFDVAGLAATRLQSQTAVSGAVPLPGSLPATVVGNSSLALLPPAAGQLPGNSSTQVVSHDSDSHTLPPPSSIQSATTHENATGRLAAASTPATAANAALVTIADPANNTRSAAASSAQAANTRTAAGNLQSVWQSYMGPPAPASAAVDSTTSVTTIEGEAVTTNSTARAANESADLPSPSAAADRRIVCHCQHDDDLGAEAGCCARASVKESGRKGEVQVTIVHFNDWHVRVEPTKEAYCALCSSNEVEQGRCNGGLARMSTFVKQQRAEDPELLLLNAGDDFIGTEWDRKAGVEAPAAFMNLLGVDVSTVGNHEWDKGLETLKKYVDMLDNDVLGGNIDFKGHELKDRIKPYVVKYVKGKKICICGLTTQYGLPSSQMGSVYVKEPYSNGRQVLESMEGEGCHATILLSHLGYTADIVAAKVLPGLDLVIGGHSHSFLWPDPNNPPAFFKYKGDYKHDSTWGPYPTNVYSYDHEVPVVTASWGSRYMGKLVLTFESEDKGGKVKDIQSDVFLLGGPNSDTHVEQDQEALDAINKWRTF